eukprot:845191_1
MTTHKQTNLSIELGHGQETQMSAIYKQTAYCRTSTTNLEIATSQSPDQIKKKKARHRCKQFVIQTFAMFARFSSLFDLITDMILLYQASTNHVLLLTTILFLSILSPYVLSYSSGIKLFIHRKTFDELVGFKNIFLILYLLPSGFFYFVLLDLIDILLSIWIWFLHNILCRTEQYLKQLEEIVAKQLGMDRMNYQGFKRQKAISQILFETVPQTILQILLVFDIIKGKELAQITNLQLQISIISAVFNLIMQLTKLYVESVAVNEFFVEYCLSAMMARVSWVPFRLKIVKLSRFTSSDDSDTAKDAMPSRSCCGKVFSTRFYAQNDGANVINYKIQYRIPIVSWLSNDAILGKVDYDFSRATIGHLIATINQIPSTNNIAIYFDDSLKLLGVKEIVNLMEICKHKHVKLLDIATCVDWNRAFTISSTIHKNDPRLATHCRDYNDRPLLISMYNTNYDTKSYKMLRSFLNNDCPLNLKDSNNETIICHMIRKRDFTAIRILFEKQKQKNCEMQNMNFYNKSGRSVLCLALKYDLDQTVKECNDSDGIDEVKERDDSDESEEEKSGQKSILSQQQNATESWEKELMRAMELQVFEPQTVANMIKFKLNCDLLKILKSIQSNLKQIRNVYKAIHFCKHASQKHGIDAFGETIISIIRTFEEDKDEQQLVDSLRETLSDDTRDFAPNGKYGHYFASLMDNYSPHLFQKAIENIQKIESQRIDDKAHAMCRLNENHKEDPKAVLPVFAIESKSELMYQMLISNGADVNFPCFDGDGSVSSPLAFVLTNYWDSKHVFGVVNLLLDLGSQLNVNDISILAHLFVNAAHVPQNNETNAYLLLLERVAHKSNTALQNVSDTDGNNPIHIALIEGFRCNQLSDRSVRNEQIDILSVLYQRYPFWLKQSNHSGNYPLYLATQNNDVDSTFCFLSFLSRTDVLSMQQMMRGKQFAQTMIHWIGKELDLSNNRSSREHIHVITLIRVFLQLFVYKDVFYWTNKSHFYVNQSPISLMRHISTKTEKYRQIAIGILSEHCMIEQYLDSEELHQLQINKTECHNNTVKDRVSGANRERNTENNVNGPDDEAKTVDKTDEIDIESDEKDNEDNESEEIDTESILSADIEEEKEPVNWIE